MYICLCNRYTDSQIREVARDGASSVAKVYRRLGNPAQCGRCVAYARQIVEQTSCEGDMQHHALPAE